MIPHLLAGLGAVRVDELILPIVRLRLVRGGIEVVAQANGPLKACEGFVRVFTAEGEAVTEQAEGDSAYMRIPNVPAGSNYTLTATMRIASMWSESR